MKRFGWWTGIGGRAIGVLGAGLGFVAFAQEYLSLSLESALLVIIAFSVGGLVILLTALESDIEENIEELNTEINARLDTIVSAVEDEADSKDMKTDGGYRSEVDPVDEIEPSGSGAFGGMIAGGAAGAAFGPPGVIIGGLLGGLVGNEIEYQNLKDEEQRKIERKAWEIVLRQTSFSKDQLDLIDAIGPKKSDRDIWEFRYRDSRDAVHLVSYRPDDSRWSYEGTETAR